ncbi:MAG: endonuclease/exonuclease/phosphatase family protein [Myxococcaceae bacterium]|nr:endonuclease/exonuclease/phosphatase family protein [Myxococcaceae bacterium]
MTRPLAPHRNSPAHQSGRVAADSANLGPRQPHQGETTLTPWATDGFTAAPPDAQPFTHSPQDTQPSDKHHHHHHHAGHGGHHAGGAGDGTTGGTDLNLGSFNVLGASHTTPGGEHPDQPGAIPRMKAAVKEIKKQKLDVIGFQEMQAPQLKEFMKLTDGKYGVYPGFKLGKRDTENSIAWNKEKYDLVEAHTIDVPYFNGNMRKMPVVTLRDKDTGQEVVMMNVHNPADTKRFHNQEAYRDKATAIELAEAKRMEQTTGLPVLFTGDFNETTEANQHVAAGSNLHAASDGRPAGIDHMYGSPAVKFTDFMRDHSKRVRYASDHPLLVGHVHIKG